MAGMDELAELIARYTVGDGIQQTALPRVNLIRSSRPTEPLHALHDPSRYLIVSIDVPVTGQVIQASPERPYLCLRLDLDPAALGALILESAPASDGRVPVSGVMLSAVTPEVCDAAVRLLRLLATPRDIPALAPLAERETLYC